MTDATVSAWNRNLLKRLTLWLDEPTDRDEYDPTGPNREERKRRVDAVRDLNTKFGCRSASDAIRSHPGAARYFEDLMHHWKEEPVTEKMTLDRFAAEMKRIANESMSIRNEAMEKMEVDIVALFKSTLESSLDINMALMIALAVKPDVEPRKIDFKKIQELFKPKPQEFEIDPNSGFAQEARAAAKRAETEAPRKVPINTGTDAGYSDGVHRRTVQASDAFGYPYGSGGNEAAHVAAMAVALDASNNPRTDYCAPTPEPPSPAPDTSCSTSFDSSSSSPSGGEF